MTGSPGGADALVALSEQIVACRACPRLVSWREQVAREKVARFADQEYWGAPVPGFGDPRARLLVVGLAPAAHGGNRTGRIFTGDRSGDFLYAGLFRAGAANRPTSFARDDGLVVRGVYLSAINRCAPPGNKPLPVEEAACRPFLQRRIAALPRLRAIVTLGDVSRRNVLKALGAKANAAAAGHGVETDIGPYRLFGSYHCSRLNTNTGRLTTAMFEDVFAAVRRHIDA